MGRGVRNRMRWVVVGHACDQRRTGDDREQKESDEEDAMSPVSYSNRQRSPEAKDLRIRRATTMRCTSSGPS